MAVRDSRISMKQMPVMPCGLHPHYSEGGINAMNPKKAFRKFGNACMSAPEGAALTVGLSWVGDGKGWRVMMAIHTAHLLLGSKDARALANIYDKHHRSLEWLGKATGVEWVAPELRNLADEAEQKNRDKIIPEGAVEHMPAWGSAQH